MKNLINISNFVGIYFLYLKDIDLLEISNLEEKATKEILGDYLFLQIQSALTLNQESGIYEIIEEDFPEIYKLVYGCEYTNEIGKIIDYKGILEYLTGMIYYNYVINNQVKQTGVGSVQFNKKENIETLNIEQSEKHASKVFDYSLKLFANIPNYVNDNNVVLFGDSGQFEFYEPKRPSIINQFNQKFETREYKFIWNTGI
jgi:hypothetical protein